MRISLLETPEVRRALLSISVDQYHRASDAGIIPQDTELVRGIILQKMTKSPLHTYTVHTLVQLLIASLPAGVYVRKEEPLTLADSEPEPDIAVVAGSAEDYRLRHPQTAHLVVEVAVATMELDREKAAIYAEADVSEYWLVLPEHKQLEVYTDPSARGYRVRRQMGFVDGPISLTAFPQIQIDLVALATSPSP